MGKKMSAVISINLIVLYIFLIFLAVLFYFCLKSYFNKILIKKNNNMVFKILESYAITPENFIDFVDYLVNDFASNYPNVNKDILRYDLLNYFILFLNGKTIPNTKLEKFYKKHNGRLPLFFLIERDFDINDRKQKKVVYYLITNQFNNFLNYCSQKDLGIQFFEWNISDKSNVCQFCKALNGKIFSWKDGFFGKFPSQNKCPTNGFCRCTAKPIDIKNNNIKLVRNKDGSYSIEDDR